MRWTLGSRGSWGLACVLAMTACTDRLIGASGGDTGDGGSNHDDGASEPETGGNDDADDDDDGNDDVADDTLATVTDPTDADETTFDGDESTGAPALPCDSVLAESRRCAFFDEALDVQLVGLDSGTVCPYLDVAWRTAPPLEGEVGGLVWHDEAFYMCVGELIRFAQDGVIESSGLPCTWVTAHDDAFVVYDGSSGGDVVREYASWEHAVALGPSTVHALSGMLASRFATADGLIYGAWHSTDRIGRRTLDTGDVQEDVVLAGFDDWVHGIDVDAGELIVVSHSDLLRFDASTGAALGEVAIGGFAGGSPLDCRAP